MSGSPVSHCASNAVNFWCKRVKQHSSNNSTERQAYMSIDHPQGKWDLTYPNPTLHKLSKHKYVVCATMLTGKHSTYMWLVSYMYTSVSFTAQYYIQQQHHHHLCKLCSDCTISQYKLHIVPTKSKKVIYIYIYIYNVHDIRVLP
jgi:hypothetical protein